LSQSNRGDNIIKIILTTAHEMLIRCSLKAQIVVRGSFGQGVEKNEKKEKEEEVFLNSPFFV